MNARIHLTDDEVRLYSKQQRVPVDVVATEHADIHADLDAWGRWQRDRYTQGTCASIEKRFDKGGRDATPPSTAPMAPDPRIDLIDQVVRAMSTTEAQHAELLRKYYVKRKDLDRICWDLDIRYEDFATWTYDARAMVINRLTPKENEKMEPAQQEKPKSDYDKQVEALKSGTKYVTLRKKKAEHRVVLRNGAVVQFSSSVKHMEGWAHDKVLEWADRCAVAVFVSDDGGKIGDRIVRQYVRPKL